MSKMKSLIAVLFSVAAMFACERKPPESTPPGTKANASCTPLTSERRRVLALGYRTLGETSYLAANNLALGVRGKELGVTSDMLVELAFESLDDGLKEGASLPPVQGVVPPAELLCKAARAMSLWVQKTSFEYSEPAKLSLESVLQSCLKRKSLETRDCADAALQGQARSYFDSVLSGLPAAFESGVLTADVKAAFVRNQPLAPTTIASLNATSKAIEKLVASDSIARVTGVRPSACVLLKALRAQLRELDQAGQPKPDPAGQLAATLAGLSKGSCRRQ